MKFYASKTQNTIHREPFYPEHHAYGLMLNPSYSSVRIPAGTRYILDSGAFQDVRTENRLTYADALVRQLVFEKNLGTKAEAIVSYDRLVDEQMKDGKQFKGRVNEEVGAQYVEETVGAAAYLYSHKESLGSSVPILSCQGTTVEQYCGCIERVLDICRDGGAILGIGGFCILSKSKRFKEDYLTIMHKMIPVIAGKGVQRMHVFGMQVFDVLIQTEIMARRYGLDVSYDTSAAEVNATFGKIWCPDGMNHHTFDGEQERVDYYCSDLAHMNISNITQFWDNFDRIVRK